MTSWGCTRVESLGYDTALEDLDLCHDYCSCGSPDPHNAGHSPSCTMTLPISVLREVESLCTLKSERPWQ